MVTEKVCTRFDNSRLDISFSWSLGACPHFFGDVLRVGMESDCVRVSDSQSHHDRGNASLCPSLGLPPPARPRKGKPVERSGRKAKGRRGTSVTAAWLPKGSQLPIRKVGELLVRLRVQTTRGGIAMSIDRWVPRDTRQANAVRSAEWCLTGPRNTSRLTLVSAQIHTAGGDRNNGRVS